MIMMTNKSVYLGPTLPNGNHKDALITRRGRVLYAVPILMSLRPDGPIAMASCLHAPPSCGTPRVKIWRHRPWLMPISAASRQETSLRDHLSPSGTNWTTREHNLHLIWCFVVKGIRLSFETELWWLEFFWRFREIWWILVYCWNLWSWCILSVTFNCRNHWACAQKIWRNMTG